MLRALSDLLCAGVRRSKAAAEAAKYVVSPITGELVPVEQMAEHMRVSLIDPKWKEQRDAMMAKIRETTKASDDEISRNLMGLAAARPDVFGTSSLPLPWLGFFKPLCSMSDSPQGFTFVQAFLSFTARQMKCTLLSALKLADFHVLLGRVYTGGGFLSCGGVHQGKPNQWQ
jgi:hypothetical protein